MSDILTFPKRITECRQEFLHEKDETLRFDSEGRGAEFTLPTFAYPDAAREDTPKSRYWSNQELASLFRVKRLLDAAGILCEVDHDCTDEGDPWFVFCDAAGEVFIHLCRIDGKYFLDSPNISSPLTGWDFTELTEGFLQRTVPQDDQPGASATGSGAGSGQRVVRFERNGKVFMHPATMLAALIWTLFLGSEDMVMLLPDSTEAQTKAVNDLTQGSEEGPAGESAAQTSPEHMAALANNPHPLALLMREMNSQNDLKFNYNTYAVGLSAIAISLGFMSDISFQDINPGTLSGLLAALFEDEAFADAEGADVAFTDIDGTTLDFVTFIQGLFGTLTEGTELAENTPDGLNEAINTDSLMFQFHLKNLAEDAAQEIGSPFTRAIEDIGATLTEAAGGPLTEVYGSVLQAYTTYTEAYTEALQANDGFLPMQTLRDWVVLAEDGDALWGDLRTIIVQDTEIRATFEVTENILEKTNSLLIRDQNTAALPFTEDYKIDFTEISTTGRPIYDEQAQAILQFIMDNSTDLEIIATKDEVMFFDSAIISADVDDIMVFSWTLDNGDIIAAMGLRSELESPDFII